MHDSIGIEMEKSVNGQTRKSAHEKQEVEGRQFAPEAQWIISPSKQAIEFPGDLDTWKAGS